MSAYPPALVGIDLGTSSVKVVVCDTDGRLLTSAAGDYGVAHPQAGWAESDPSQWWVAVGTCTREAVSAATLQFAVTPVAVGLSGQMHGVVPTRADGTPSRPAMLWSDSRAGRQLATYLELPVPLRRRLRNPLVPGMAGPMLAWVAQHEPDVFAATAHALQPKDWLRLQLTGDVGTDPSDASATLLWDVTGDRWDVEVAAALGLDTPLLPPVARSSSERAGTLLDAAARHLGLPAGIPVAVGGADTAVAMYGSDVVPGSAQLTVGTGIQIVTPRPSLPAVAGAEPVAHLYRTVEAAGWYAMAASVNGGSTLAWVRQILGLSWPELYRVAELPSRLDDPLFIPHLHGERTPWLDGDLRGAWTGLSPRHDRERLARSALEGVAIAARIAAETLDLPADTVVRLAGGGTTAPPWRQLLSDALGRTLYSSDTSAASSLGAARLAGRAAGLPSTAPGIRVEECARPRAHEVEVFAERDQLLRQQVELLRLRP